eukprot:CAMPEP_0185771746 /NCGR_PEP_ID=MMETSP1174-20130828/64958_1 /TAXON_ID=35687 /ORGANISM="Dictyocha speculum, Strain CCMP1381" /LENGTH=164 /DNA_ID=CAMNT_0028457699 /DNA_START=10 /DNA_END=504 /DNA_ORIENTATION=+
MPKFALKIKCQLSNVAQFSWTDNNQWCMTLRNGDESSTCDAYFTSDEEHDLSGSRGIAHFIKKWPGENSQSYLKIIEPKNMVKTQYSKDDDQEWVTALVIDCRGVEPIKWMPRCDFTIESESGSTFPDEDVEFDEDGEEFLWADVDEGGEEVSISSLQYRFDPC